MSKKILPQRGEPREIRDRRPMSALTVPADQVIAEMAAMSARKRNVRSRSAWVAEMRYVGGL